MEGVFVCAIGLGGEVVPRKTLYGMFEGADLGLLVRHGDDVLEHLEPIHEELLVLGGILPMDGETEQSFLERGAGLDGEGDGIHTCNREHLAAAHDLGLESHCRSSSTLSGPNVPLHRDGVQLGQCAVCQMWSSRSLREHCHGSFSRPYRVCVTRPRGLARQCPRRSLPSFRAI